MSGRQKKTADALAGLDTDAGFQDCYCNILMTCVRFVVLEVIGYGTDK